MTITASGTVKELIDVSSFRRGKNQERPYAWRLTSLLGFLPFFAGLRVESQEGAYADVVVKLGLIKLLTKRFDVCEEL